MYRVVQRCRACNYSYLQQVFDLGIQPLANDFCLADDDHAGYAPLKVLFCQKCTLAQLSVVVDPNLLYRHYNYVTSNSRTMREHFKTLLRDICANNEKGSVLEIGSNDGAFLAFMSKSGFGPVLGIDPAANLADLAAAAGVETMPNAFSRASAEDALRVLGRVDTIIARHVFCHVDDWRDFLVAVEAISHTGTLICIETPYVVDLLRKAEFDTLYHEHTSYLSINALAAALYGTGLFLDRVIHYPIHGGAILLMLRKGTVRHNAAWLEESITIGDWKAFTGAASRKIGKLKAFIDLLAEKGKTVAGYGASAKSTVWVNACEFTEKQIRFITDNTPQKIGKLSPGSNIPVVDEKELLELKPDYCIMFAWNYRDEIIEKNQAYLKQGGKFIVPSPELEVI